MFSLQEGKEGSSGFPEKKNGPGLVKLWWWLIVGFCAISLGLLKNLQRFEDEKRNVTCLSCLVAEPKLSEKYHSNRISGWRLKDVSINSFDNPSYRIRLVCPTLDPGLPPIQSYDRDKFGTQKSGHIWNTSCQHQFWKTPLTMDFF